MAFRKIFKCALLCSIPYFAFWFYYLLNYLGVFPSPRFSNDFGLCWLTISCGLTPVMICIFGLEKGGIFSEGSLVNRITFIFYLLATIIYSVGFLGVGSIIIAYMLGAEIID